MRAVPRIISPDDHVQAPAHVWQDRLPAALRDRGPRIERLRGMADLGHGDIRFVDDPDGHLADVWHYDGKRIPLVRIAAAAGVPREEVDARADHLRRHAQGLLRPDGPPRRHGHGGHRGVRLLPEHVRPLLRPDVLAGAGQGPRAGLHQGLQRLHRRGVVRRLERPARPDGHRAALGRRPGGRRGRAPRRARVPLDHVLRAARTCSACRRSTPRPGTRSFAACAATRSWCRCTSAPGGSRPCQGLARGGAQRHRLVQRRLRAGRLAVLRPARPVPRR